MPCWDHKGVRRSADPFVVLYIHKGDANIPLRPPGLHCFDVFDISLTFRPAAGAAFGPSGLYTLSSDLLSRS